MSVAMLESCEDLELAEFDLDVRLEGASAPVASKTVGPTWGCEMTDPGVCTLTLFC
ncbi:hypothetical protein [Streptomyces armeniacus]|uniref:hypothetical protein n=1 Tax=Streptomyces armeniacus TaxID=83291 RepID=UPI001AD80DBD|nr:hypothetical protein [Streptomyces armeniacus]